MALLSYGLCSLAGLASVALAGPAVRAADSPRLYEIATETMMPHLEDNLRYATTTRRECLDEAALHRAFPILTHWSMTDCTLGPQTPGEAGVTLPLACTGGHGASGGALWQRDSIPMQGRLDVRLGGKNMTFYQRLIVKPLGECEAPAP